MSEKIVKRSDKIAFMDVGTSEAEDFQRMRKFTEISTSKIQRNIVDNMSMKKVKQLM